jgi:transcriptional regulator with XRE-family HTH domain
MSNKVREFREKAGISQTELARRVRIACTNLSAVECGRLAAWPKVRKALSRELRVSEAELFPNGNTET